MNYLAHAVRFLDRPEFVAGAALPDWLSVVDRKVRLRPKHVEPWFDHEDRVLAEVARGVAQHHHDDGWFHSSRGFVEVSGELARMFHAAVGQEDGFRCWFLGHIVTEMLIDSVLIDEEPARLQNYYDTLEQIDPEAVQAAVNRMSPKPTQNLPMFIRMFRRERFLFDYQESPRLLVRLNQVLWRVKLVPLPENCVDVLDAGRQLVRSRLDDLLPADKFSQPNSPAVSLTKDSLP